MFESLSASLCVCVWHRTLCNMFFWCVLISEIYILFNLYLCLASSFSYFGTYYYGTRFLLLLMMLLLLCFSSSFFRGGIFFSTAATTIYSDSMRVGIWAWDWNETLRIVDWDFTMHALLAFNSIVPKIWKAEWNQLISHSNAARRMESNVESAHCRIAEPTIEIEWMFREIDKIKTEVKKGRIQQLFPFIPILFGHFFSLFCFVALHPPLLAVFLAFSH